MDRKSSSAKPTRARFSPSFRTAAYPSKISPFSDSVDEPFFDERSIDGAKLGPFATAEERRRFYHSIIKDEPGDYKAHHSSRHHDSSIPQSRKTRSSKVPTVPTPPASDGSSPEEQFKEYESAPSAKIPFTRDQKYGRSSRKYEDDGTDPVPKDSSEDLRGKFAENPFSDPFSDPSSDASPEAEDDLAYSAPKGSSEDLRGETARNSPYDAHTDAYSDAFAEHPLSGVDINIVATIFIGISVTFRELPEHRAYELMEIFLHNYHSNVARNFDQEGIKEIYEYMKTEKSAKNYCDMDQERVQEFEKETKLSHFMRRVKFTD